MSEGYTNNQGSGIDENDDLGIWMTELGKKILFKCLLEVKDDEDERHQPLLDAHTLMRHLQCDVKVRLCRYRNNSLERGDGRWARVEELLALVKESVESFLNKLPPEHPAIGLVLRDIKAQDIQTKALVPEAEPEPDSSHAGPTRRNSDDGMDESVEGSLPPPAKQSDEKLEQGDEKSVSAYHNDVLWILPIHLLSKVQNHVHSDAQLSWEQKQVLLNQSDMGRVVIFPEVGMTGFS
jgi:hypothetical protein